MALEKLCGLPDPNDDIFIHSALDRFLQYFQMSGFKSQIDQSPPLKLLSSFPFAKLTSALQVHIDDAIQFV